MEIGFIGLGAMGSRMAANVIKAGHEVWAYDISPRAVDRIVELGAHRCSSSRDASEGRDAVLLSLTTPAVVEAVVAGPEGVLSASVVPKLLIDLSSGFPSVSKRLAAIAAEKGCQMLDAPVSGGTDGATKGRLSIMVGGPVDAYERALPLLRCIGKSIFHIGDSGSGNAIKLVNQVLNGVHMAAISEAIVMGAKAGIKPRVMYDVVMASNGYSRTFQNRVSKLMAGDFEPGFTIDLMHKDMELAAQFGQELGVPMPVLNLSKQMYQAARAAGLGSLDFGALAILLERLMGVEVRDDQPRS